MAEPIEIWRAYARYAQAVVRLASEAHQGRPGRPEDVAILWPGSAGLVDVEGTRLIVAEAINSWLRLTGATPRFEWDARPALTFTGGAFVGLAVELMALVSQAAGVEFCADCGQPYQPSRRPRPGERHYCTECGKRAGQRNASRAYRARKRTQSV